MRLIDLDELRASLAADPGVGVYEWKRLDVAIDAAPTISCAECEHSGACDRLLKVGGDVELKLGHCSCFQRRQP
jgi:hypothetical protein